MGDTDVRSQFSRCNEVLLCMSVLPAIIWWAIRGRYSVSHLSVTVLFGPPMCLFGSFPWSGFGNGVATLRFLSFLVSCRGSFYSMFALRAPWGMFGSQEQIGPR